MPVAVLGGTVYFDEDVKSPNSIRASRFATENPINRETTRTGRILWAQIEQFLAECIPSSPFLPGQHPGAPYLYVDSVTINPEVAKIDDCTGAIATHLTAVATVNYRPLDYTPDRITRNTSFSMEVMNIPFSHLYWAGESQQLGNIGNDPNPEDDINGEVVPNPDITAYIHIPVVEHSYTFDNVPLVNAPAITAAIEANLGKINDGVFDGHPSESLLFAGGRITFTFGNLGFQTFSYEYSFHQKIIKEKVEEPAGSGTYVEKTRGWNHHFKADGSGDGSWGRLSRRQDKYEPIYEMSTTFADLFTGTVI